MPSYAGYYFIIPNIREKIQHPDTGEKHLSERLKIPSMGNKCNAGKDPSLDQPHTKNPHRRIVHSQLKRACRATGSVWYVISYSRTGGHLLPELWQNPMHGSTRIVFLRYESNPRSLVPHFADDDHDQQQSLHTQLCRNLN